MGEVKSIKTSYNSMRGDFDVNVIFKDEPHVLYQFCYSDVNKSTYLNNTYRLSNNSWVLIPSDQSKYGKGLSS